MSTESLSTFRQAMNDDEKLQQAVHQEIKKRGITDLSELADSIMRLAAERGLQITLADLDHVMEDGELTDFELEMVAGGGGCCCGTKD